MGDYRTWSQLEQRAAFYSGVVRRGQLLVSEEVCQKWREALPKAIEQEYERLDSGELPRLLTPQLLLSNVDCNQEAFSSERVAGSR